MTRLIVSLAMHVEATFDDPVHGPCVTIDRHSDAPLLEEFDGVAIDGSRCQAITLERERCPKRGAVAIIVNEAWVHLCGTHMGTHRAGDRLVEAVIVAYSDAHIPIRCVRCGHETRWHVDGACACEGDGVAGLCPCQEPPDRDPVRHLMFTVCDVCNSVFLGTGWCHDQRTSEVR